MHKNFFQSMLLFCICVRTVMYYSVKGYGGVHVRVPDCSDTSLSRLSTMCAPPVLRCRLCFLLKKKLCFDIYTVSKVPFDC